MRLVDASVVVKFALDEHDFTAARALAQEPLYAPELILGETANGWWKAWRKGALSAEDFAAAVHNLPSLFDRLEPTEPLLTRAADFSRQLGHPVYDCIYLALAESRGDTLITADLKLLGKLKDTELASLASPLI